MNLSVVKCRNVAPTREISPTFFDNMGSKVVVTYKRKRLFSRSDHSPLRSDKPSEVSDSKSSAHFNKHEERIGICHEHSKNNVGENGVHFENRDSVCCGQCSEKQDYSSISKEAQKSDVIILEEILGETCRANSSDHCNAEEKSADTQQELLVKRGLEYEDKCKEETDKFNEGRDSTSCNNFGTKRKLNSTLITFYRRCKRKKDEKKSRGEVSSSQGEICMDVQDHHHLSISSRATLDIDCNLPLDCGSNENELHVPLEVTHDSLGSTSKTEENIPSLQENDSPVVSDKGKFAVDSPSTLRNNYLQLFPENIPNKTLHLTNDPQKATGPHPSTFPSSHFHNFSLPLDHTVHNHASYSSPYNHPNIQAHSFTRHKMMLDNILTRARAIRGNTWSEEELDCLWVGVRRHGRGNWDFILRDRGLHFSPWKTPLDLADRWHEEQSRLFCNTPVFHQNRRFYQKPIANASYGNLAKWGLLSPYVGNPSLREESSCSAGAGGPMRGSLPHWLREAVEMPPRPFEPMQWRNDHQNDGKEKAHCTGRSGPHDREISKQEELIVIPSDASSEETISDDRSIRL